MKILKHISLNPMQSHLIDTAYDYLYEGLNPLPLRNNKAPMLPVGHNYLYQSVEDAAVDELFKKAEKIGIACGKVSGQFECLDFDGKDGEPIAALFGQFIANDTIAAVIGRNNLPCFSTPSGGRHIYYRYEGDCDRSRVLAHWPSGKVMIETRGHGSYVAVHPSAGYVKISGSDIVKVATITAEERDCLIAVAESLTQHTRTTGTGGANGKSDRKWPEKFDTSTPIGRYNEQCEQEAKDLLLKAGWKYLYTRGYDGVEYWQRPGKDSERAISATWGRKYHMFYCWTDMWEPFNKETAYTPFDVFMLLSHDGNITKATAALYNRWEPPRPELSDKFIGTKPTIPTPVPTPAPIPQQQEQEEPELIDPVTFFNTANTPRFYVKNLLEELKWKRIPDTSPEVWRTQDADDSEVSATFDTCLHIVSNSCTPFKQGRTYTPYEILLFLRFNGNFRAATEWIITKYFGETIPYIRVGVDYFKVIEAIDRFGIPRKELAKWTKDEIKEDHGKQFISRIPRFNKFVTKPDNINYTPIVGNNYNLYREFPHKPYPGQWPWTEILLRHIFGEQYHLGIRYLQALYLNPEHIMPILVLVSQERQTGKTTFINWLGMVFGDNMANIAPDDLINGFNAPYAASNIIAVEETLIEKAITVEKIKALATQKHITVNQKFVSQYRTPFYGKIILTSNNETKFAKIDQEEIRFFIRKVPVPTTVNHNIEEDMIPEIPAFLHYLTTLPPVDWSRDRTGFTPQELDNESLKAVKDESKTEIARDFRIMIEDLFLNELKAYDEFYADAKAIKDRYYAKDPRNGYDWIQKILKKDFGLNPTEKSIYFKPFVTEPGKTGRPFTFKRSDFVTSEPEQTEYQETIPF